MPTVQEAQLQGTNTPTRGSIKIPSQVFKSAQSESPSFIPLMTPQPSIVMLDETKSTRTASAQDFLIIANVILSFVKTSVAVFTYSWLNVVMSLVELVVTSITLVIFILNDFVKDDGTSQYGDNILVYLISFGISIIVEVVGVVIACKTVIAYKKLQNECTEQGLSNVKNLAQGSYGFYFVLGIISTGIVSFIAMSKANWVVDHFAPFDFIGQVETLVYWLVGLSLLSQFLGGLYMLNASEESTLRTANGEIGWALKLQMSLGFVYSILVYITLSKVSGEEAGGFCYLFLISSPQAVELVAEVGRHSTIIVSLDAPEDILNGPNFLRNLFWHKFEERYPQQAADWLRSDD